MKEFKKISDYERGYSERMVGYYDKWYRNNRADNGAEYDKGVAEAVLNPQCVNECTIIESYNIV